MNKLALLCCTTGLAGLGMVASTAPARAAEPALSTVQGTAADSYPVLCITRTIPIDPEPYVICIYYPL